MKTNETKREMMYVMFQALYGNRVVFRIPEEDVDMYIQGCMSREDFNPERNKIDRTIVPLPGTENLVLIYNKYQEERRLKRDEERLRVTGHEAKPLAVIPELDLKIYSRPAVCRISEDGHLESLQPEDMEAACKYLLP